MSGSGAGEMAPTSSKAVVFPKFDMHFYTSELTSSELEAAVADYLIPMDLHPRLPPPGMTMDKLPSRAIGFLSRIKPGVRHGDTDLHDDFPSNFNQDDVERLSEFLVPLRLPPLISMDTFLKLPTWTGTIVSKGDPIPENQRPKSRNVTAKRAGVRHAGGSRKKRKVQKQNEPTQSGSEETLSASPIRQAHPEASKSPAIVIPLEVTQEGPHVEKDVVDLSGNTRVSTPPATANQPSPPLGHHDADENPEPDKLVNHVATPIEDEFLGTSSNAEVLSRAYQTLGQSVVAQGELLKRHEQLNHDHVDLRNRHDTDLAELERLRSGLRKANQDKDEMTKKSTLLDNNHSECTSREKELSDMVKELEKERDEWRAIASDQLCFTAGWLGGLALGRTEEEVVRFLLETQDLDIKGSKTWEERHRALFPTPYPYVQKIADSCDLPLSELWSLHPDAPSPEGVTLGGAAESTVQRPPSTSSKTTSDISFGTTT
nr:hypothetical protein [Tanacetum cinerariifolium]